MLGEIVLVFSSNVFLFAYLPAALLLYYLCPRRWRNALLFAVSLVFYGWGEPVYLGLMLFTIALNYLAGLIIERRRSRGRSPRAALAAAIVLNLALLGFFKYTGFLLGSLKALIPGMSSLSVPEIALPIGISFYIFQSMSYTIDVYRRDAPVQRDPIGFGAYVSMFPQLIAGPIVKYKDVAEQLSCRRESLEKFASGVGVFIIGLGKKLLLANQMGLLWEELSCSGGTASAWVGMLAYTLQIYFDFSGYSDMAIGLGRMLGFEFLKNFDYPYISRSVTEFWRRWHISLSTWFREYVYIPLGGNRRGLKRQLLNIFIVWALTGLWHGASWNFVLWGLYYALWLTAEKVFLLRALEKLPSALRCLGVLLVVALGWMLFYFTDTGELFAFLARLFSFSAEDVYSRNMILAYLPTLALAVFAATPAGKSLYLRLREGRVKDALSILGLGAVFLLCTAALASQSYNPFIYFRF